MSVRIASPSPPLEERVGERRRLLVFAQYIPDAVVTRR
jgi:hypothetical protein